MAAQAPRGRLATRRLRLALICVTAWALALAGCGAEDSQAPADGDAATASDGGFDPARRIHSGETSGATARYDLQGGDWHALPFPSDHRRRSDGSLDLSGFPPPRTGDQSSLLSGYLALAGQLRDGGWSIQPTLYVQFDLPLDAKKLVQGTETLTDEAPYFLVALTPGRPDTGKRIALRASLSPSARGQHLAANLLMLQPLWGQPLREDTTYALVVRRSLRDATGKVLGQPAVLRDVVAGWQKGLPAAQVAGPLQPLYASLEPLRQAIASGQVAVPWDDLAAVTVLTTGHPTAALHEAAAWLRQAWQPQAATDWKVVHKGQQYWLLEATYQAPNFQQGDCPYDTPGSGGLVWQPDGQPLVDHTETMRVSVMLPVQRPLDGNGLTPINLSAHGTGGDWRSYEQGGAYTIAAQLAPRGIAIASIDQPMHGLRCGKPLGDSELDFKTFNFVNIAAGRGGFRQSALDTVALTRMVRDGLLDPPAALSPYGVAYRFDPLRVSFSGHSQGGISGALVAAVEPAIHAMVLSGAGAGLSLTILQRKDPLDIAEAVRGLLGLDEGELSEFHPAVSLVQLLADAVDPLAYGYAVRTRSAGQWPPHILLTEGLLDTMTPADTAEALAAALGLDVLAPAAQVSAAMALSGAQVLQPPVSGNRQVNDFPVTAVLSQWPKLDHFAIFDSAEVAGLYATFLQTAAETLTATAAFAP